MIDFKSNKVVISAAFVFLFAVILYFVWPYFKQSGNSKLVNNSGNTLQTSESTTDDDNDIVEPVINTSEFTNSEGEVIIISHVSVTTTPPSTTIYSSKPKPKPAKKLDYRFGLSVGETFSWKNSADLDESFAYLSDLGVGWLRIDLDWSTIQPRSADKYSWESFDKVVAAANLNNIKILAVLAYTPKWARPDYCNSVKCAPTDPAVYATFAAAAVKRYSPLGVKHWEVWNEPNSLGFWKPEVSPRDYTKLLKLTYESIKSVDKDAFVITGGLAPSVTANGNISPIEFIDSIYYAGGKKYFDAIGFHPYSYPILPTTYKIYNAWSQMGATPLSVRDIMNKYSDGSKQIWLTEFGAPTGGPGKASTIKSFTLDSSYDHVDEELQAEMVKIAIKEVRDNFWMGPLFWYSYRDLDDINTTNENFFGLVRLDGTLKPAYNMFKNLLTSTPFVKN